MLSKIRMLTVCMLAALVFAGIAGCNRGPKTIKVQGNITINGEPAEGVHVEFHPQPTGRYGLGITEKNGDYEVQFTRSQKGALPGPNIVRIMAFRNPENDSTQYLPSEYNSAAEENPDLNVEVSRDNYEFNFNIEMDADELAEHRANSGVPEEE